MDLHAGEMAGIRVKGYFDLTLEHFAQSSADSTLFSLGQGRGGGHGDLLNAFRRIGKLREGLGDFGKKADAILLHQLSEKCLPDGREPQTCTEFCEDGTFDFGPKRSLVHD